MIQTSSIDNTSPYLTRVTIPDLRCGTSTN